MTRKQKLIITVAVVGTFAVIGDCLWFAYAPEHWLERIDFAKVLLDGHPAQADVYWGRPTYNEAEIIALAHVPGVGDYFFDFDDEAFRPASNHEFIRLHRGVWTYKSMREGHFSAVLPFQNDNEFRIVSSKGHILTVRF